MLSLLSNDATQKVQDMLEEARNMRQQAREKRDKYAENSQVFWVQQSNVDYWDGKAVALEKVIRLMKV